MKKLLSSLLLVFAFALIVNAQVDDNWPSLSYLRRDYNQSKIVARVTVREAEIVNRIVGYEDWRIVCDVVEPFKAGCAKVSNWFSITAPKPASRKRSFSATRSSSSFAITSRKKRRGFTR